MVNPPPRMTYPLSDFVIDEKYLGSKEYWRRSGLTKSRYMISNKGQVKGPRGMIRSPKRDNSIEVRNRKGNPQFFRLARLMCEAFTTFEYDNKEHRFCWLDGDKDNQTLSNLGVQVLSHEVRASPAECEATAPHIIRIKIEGEDTVVERRTHRRSIVLRNLVEKENLTDIWLVSHGKVGDADRWTYSARRKTDGEQDR